MPTRINVPDLTANNPSNRNGVRYQSEESDSHPRVSTQPAKPEMSDAEVNAHIAIIDNMIAGDEQLSDGIKATLARSEDFMQRLEPYAEMGYKLEVAAWTPGAPGLKVHDGTPKAINVLPDAPDDGLDAIIGGHLNDSLLDEMASVLGVTREEAVVQDEKPTASRQTRETGAAAEADGSSQLDEENDPDSDEFEQFYSADKRLW